MKRFGYVLLSLVILSCQKETGNKYFSNLDDTLNIFNIKETGYYYDKSPIYSTDIYLSSPSSFIRHNFLIFKKKLLLEIPLYSNCLESYKKNNYSLNEMFLSSGAYNQCDINFYPVVDFGLCKGDTMHIYQDYWITLKDYSYNKKIKDTVYRFERNWGANNTPTTIFISKNRGVLGISGMNQDEVFSNVGLTFSDKINKLNKNDIRKPSIDLDVIKEFKRNY